MSVNWQTEVYNALELRDMIEKSKDDFFTAFQLSTQRVEDLEQKIEAIQLTDLQMELANNLVKIEELSVENNKLSGVVLSEGEKSTELQKIATDLERNLGVLREAYTLLDKKFKTLKEETQQKIQILESVNDEVLSLQIENNVLNDQNQELKSENDKLIKRWLEKVEKDAQLLNDAIGKNEKAI